MPGMMNAPLPKITHTVLSGKLRFNCYRDGDTLRDVSDGCVKAWKKGDGWTRPVALTKPNNPKAWGRWDTVKRLPGLAVVVELSKGRYY